MIDGETRLVSFALISLLLSALPLALAAEVKLPASPFRTDNR